MKSTLVLLSCLVAGCLAQDICKFEVPVSFTTQTFLDDDETSVADADDAAVIKLTNGSFVFVGTLKNAGMMLFNNQGQVIQTIDPAPAPGESSDGFEAGRLNNVGAVRTPDGRDLVIVSDRGYDIVRVFDFSEENLLNEITAENVPFLFNENFEQVKEQRTAYGLTASVYNDEIYAFISQRERSTVAMIKITLNDDGLATYDAPSLLQMPLPTIVNGVNYTVCTEEDGEEPQLEGIFLDPSTGVLYLSQETVGLFSTTVETFEDASALQFIDGVNTLFFGYQRVPIEDEPGEFECEYDFEDDSAPVGITRSIVSDAEGLSMYKSENISFLVLSAQGSSSYHLYEMKPQQAPELIAQMQIRVSSDAFTASTDGVEVFSGELAEFKNGLLVVQSESTEAEDTTFFAGVDMNTVLDELKLCGQTVPPTASPTSTASFVAPGILFAVIVAVLRV